MKAQKSNKQTTEDLVKLAERVQCGHRACKALIKAVKQLGKSKEDNS